MIPKFFPSQSDFRKWLEKNHESETELFVGYYRVSSGKLSMTWSQSVDQALCFGWIDGIRRSIDGESYYIRFTPRKKNSNWSNINLKKVIDLNKARLMKPRGIAAFENRSLARINTYAFEREEAEFSPHFEKNLKQTKLHGSFSHLRHHHTGG